LDKVRSVLASEPLLEVEYAELVDPETFEPVSEVGDGALLALAVHVGKTRLIDNALLAAA